MREGNLSINIETLLDKKRIESDRIEFKAGWNANTIYRSICAFANDFDNIGGGYILIGVQEDEGKASRPVKGLTESEIAKIQKEMIGFNTLIRPSYAPILSIEMVDNNNIIALWVPGGTERPYEVPENITHKNKQFKFYIRRYASTIEAKGREKEELFSLANQIPFDDRLHRKAQIDDINLIYIQDYLRLSGSRLLEQIGTISSSNLLQHLNLIGNLEKLANIKNVALMLFSDNPEKFFPYSYVDIVHFEGKPSGRTFTEKKCIGPMHVQIRQALEYLSSNVIEEKVIKISGQAEANRFWNYPFDALEEAIVNSVYHRDYSIPEPISIRIEKHQIMIYNCGGPDRSLKLQDLEEGIAVSSRYRNRRLGDFLKEMELTEGRSTGLSLIQAELRVNGSPKAVIESDEMRTFFRIIFKIHQSFEKEENFKEVKLNNEMEIANKLSLLLSYSDSVSDVAGDVADDLVIMAKILILIFNKRSNLSEIFATIGRKPHSDTRRRYIDPLEKLNLIEKTIPDKITSPKQQYQITDKGAALFK